MATDGLMVTTVVRGNNKLLPSHNHLKPCVLSVSSGPSCGVGFNPTPGVPSVARRAMAGLAQCYPTLHHPLAHILATMVRRKATMATGRSYPPFPHPVNLVLEER